MTIVSMTILLGFAVVSAIVLASWRRRVDVAELGNVSARWLAEQRAVERYESER